MIRDGFRGVTAAFLQTVALIDTAQWEQPGLGEWTVRALVGHMCTALFVNVERGIDHPAAHLELERPIDFWLQGRPTYNAAAIAQSGREAGAALGELPAHGVHQIVDRVLPRIDATSDDTLITTRAGGMRLIDYLATRVFEGSIHVLDLAAALQREVPLPEPAAAVALQLLGDRARITGQVAPLLLAATGRCPLPTGYSVV